MSDDTKTDAEQAVKRLSDPDAFEDCLALMRMWRKLDPTVTFGGMCGYLARISTYGNGSNSKNTEQLRESLQALVDQKRTDRVKEFVKKELQAGHIESLERLLEIEP